MKDTKQELEKLELLNSRFKIFKEAMESKSVELNWALENILGFSKDDIKTITSIYPAPGRMLKKIMKVKDWKKIYRKK